MKNNLAREIAVSVTLILLMVLLLNPFHFWMPEMLTMLMLAITFIIFSLFAIFVVRENVRDEREAAHRLLSGRIAFLAGSAMLTLGITVQSLYHDVDAWLVVTLVMMILVKISSRMYGDSRW